MTIKRRRREGKTDYKARLGMLKSGKGRIVFRKTNRYIIGQYVKSKEARDYVVVGVFSKSLLQYGWPKNSLGSLKSLPASYLTGFLLGKRLLDSKEKEGIFDTGLLRNIAKSKPYAFLKGVIDAGFEVSCKKDMFPDDKRIIDISNKIRLNLDKIKEEIGNKYIGKGR